MMKNKEEEERWEEKRKPQQEQEEKTHLTNFIWLWQRTEKLCQFTEENENENHNLFYSWFINLISVHHA